MDGRRDDRGKCRYCCYQRREARWGCKIARDQVHVSDDAAMGDVLVNLAEVLEVRDSALSEDEIVALFARAVAPLQILASEGFSFCIQVAYSRLACYRIQFANRQTIIENASLVSDYTEPYGFANCTRAASKCIFDSFI